MGTFEVWKGLILNLLEELIHKYDTNEEYIIEDLPEYTTLYLEISRLYPTVIYLKLMVEKLEIIEISLSIIAYEVNSGWDNEIIHIDLIVKNLFLILKKIYIKYNILCIYQVEEYFDRYSHWGCPPTDGLEATIYISKNTDSENIISLINLIKMITLSKNNILYKKLNIYPLTNHNLTLHKKAKNINYFFEIIKSLNNSSVPIYNANIAFEKILSKVDSDIKIGLIEFQKTKKIGYSAKPYIDTLKDLNILQVVNDKYILDKTSKWFLELEDYIKNNNNLSILEKYYFLKKILTIDFQYIYELFEIIYIVGQANLTEISKLFQEKHKEYSNLGYVKGLVSLRIHWLKNLGLLKDEREIQFTSTGLIFFDEIMKMRTLYLDVSTSMNAFLLLEYTDSFSKLTNIKACKEKNLDILIKKYLPIVFKLHINKFNKRAIISSVINSIIILSLLEESSLLEYEDIKDIITNSNILKELGYSLSYSNKEQDGYIKRI